MRKFLSTTTGKIALSVSVLGVGGAMAGLGTFATFTSTTSATQSVTAGTVAIGLGVAGPANRINVAATGVVPGDTIQRAFDLTNSGNQNLATVGLTTTASPSSLLDTDATNGLQMTVNKCSVAWTEAGSAPAYTYTCSGVTTPIITSQAVIGANINMAGLSALTAGSTDHLHLLLSLPSGTGNTFQGLSSTISYSFLGTQRTSTNQ
ncbi:MAG: TasA family protein [Acidimicrobiales bacterium]